MAWDHRYRRLNEGETICQGDEVLCDKDWEPAGRTVGNKAPNPLYTSHRVYRRKKTAEWDAYYRGLPVDLKRKLSVHDFKRLGDVFMDAFNNSPDVDASGNCPPQVH